MKQLFILFLFLAIYSINCSLLECELETDLTKCFDHKVEDVENFSCHRCNYDLSALRGIIDEDDEETLYPDNFKNIRLNKNSTSDLQCTNKIGYIECNVDKDHFSQKDDYYHTYHKHNEEMIIAYEVPLIHVILKDKGGNNTSDNDDDGDKTALIVGLSVAGAIVLAILLFFIIHYIRKNKVGTDSSSKIEEEAKQLLEVTSPSDVKEGQEGP